MARGLHAQEHGGANVQCMQRCSRVHAKVCGVRGSRQLAAHLQHLNAPAGEHAVLHDAVPALPCDHPEQHHQRHAHVAEAAVPATAQQRNSVHAHQLDHLLISYPIKYARMKCDESLLMPYQNATEWPASA
eukprot:GHRQ01036835.1.p1 GENE.GHRQ01036835.1~~GHRQ01036835.1.p1  ORF type:complete len:131 (+),score=23.65 GHRQ01036835.1:181-573(+)